MNSHEGCEEMSLTKGSKGTKRTKTPTTQQNKHQNKPKPTTRRPNTEVKRGDEFLSSCSQYRTSRTKLHSACWQAGIPQEMQCVSVCMSKTESKSEVQIRFFLGPFRAGHYTTCFKECVRAIDHVSIFKVTNSVLRTPHACGTKFQSARILGLVIAQPGIPLKAGVTAGIAASQPCGARSGRRFRIDASSVSTTVMDVPSVQKWNRPLNQYASTQKTVGTSSAHGSLGTPRLGGSWQATSRHFGIKWATVRKTLIRVRKLAVPSLLQERKAPHLQRGLPVTSGPLHRPRLMGGGSRAVSCGSLRTQLPPPSNLNSFS